VIERGRRIQPEGRRGREGAEGCDGEFYSILSVVIKNPMLKKVDRLRDHLCLPHDE
jgi:hypothetical protein